MSATAFVGRAENAARDKAREAAPWIEKLARLGFLAKAVLYITIGVLTSAAALRLGGTAATGSRGAMAELLDAPFGHVLLGVIAVGLFGYAAWRIIEGITDPKREGTKAKGIAKRIRSIGVGLVHVALGLSAVKLATGDVSAANDGAMTQSWAARAMQTPGGTYALWGIAAAFVGYGAYQVYKAWKTKLGEDLALGNMSPRWQKYAIGVSRFGIAARGVVFGMIGFLVGSAAQHHDPSKARGIKLALQELAAYGRGPFVVIATGLIAYGIYQLINARYRRIRAA